MTIQLHALGFRILTHTHLQSALVYRPWPAQRTQITESL